MADNADRDALPADIAAMSFEDALAALEAVVKRLEAGEGSLDESIGAYERGVLLKRHCEAKLREAEAKVERISLAADGSARAEPADLG
ncbi:MAG: exodeoxyribonuclease VII small subunit [Alphaproteobacteria bacterium]